MNATPAWLDTSEYPFQSHYFPVNGQQLHYIDEGEGDTLLFVHGTPSWSFDFRNIIRDLRNSFRCIAIDHMGFGLSDKPAVYDYSTQTHSATLEKFIHDKKLDNISLIVHDFGGPIGINVAIRNPALFKKIIILNSWLWDSRQDPDFIKFSKVLKSPLLPFLYKYLNFSPRFILPRSFGDHKLPKKILHQYTRPFGNSSQRNGALAFARSLLNDQQWFETLWEERKVIDHLPVMVIWGMKDPVIKPHYLDKWASGFSNITIYQLEHSGHFPQEEEPDRVNNLIKEFLNVRS